MVTSPSIRLRRGRVPSGQYRLTSPNGSLTGYGEGDFIRLRDEQGSVWSGTACRQPDDSIRYMFRDQGGRHASGVSDGNGIMLRDETGRCWRGIVD